jgi:hypothetical protein
MRMITSDDGEETIGMIDNDDTDQTIAIHVRSLPEGARRIARGTGRPPSNPQLAQLLVAAQQHSEMMIGLACNQIVDEIDNVMGMLTRADYDAVLVRVVQTIARRRSQRDDG